MGRPQARWAEYCNDMHHMQLPGIRYSHRCDAGARNRHSLMACAAVRESLLLDRRVGREKADGGTRPSAVWAASGW